MRRSCWAHFRAPLQVWMCVKSRTTKWSTCDRCVSTGSASRRTRASPSCPSHSWSTRRSPRSSTPSRSTRSLSISSKSSFWTPPIYPSSVSIRACSSRTFRSVSITLLSCDTRLLFHSSVRILCLVLMSFVPKRFLTRLYYSSKLCEVYYQNIRIRFYDFFQNTMSKIDFLKQEKFNI